MLLNFSLSQNANVNYSKSAEKLVLYCFFLLLCYPLVVFSCEAKWTFINLFIYSYSSFLFIYCFLTLQNSRVQTWNLLGFCYFLPLWLNTLQISSMQVEKGLLDLCIIILGPILFVLLLKHTEKISMLPVRFKLNLININYIYMLFIFIYISLSFYIYSKVGWRFDAIRIEHRIISGTQFVVPIFSGVLVTLSWSLVILSVHVQKKYACLAISCICFFSGILGVKRGDIVRIILFFVIYYLASKNPDKEYNSFRKFIIIFFMGSIFVAVFVVFGQWRLAQSGNTEHIIIEMTGVRVDNAYLAWLFAYLIIQFDVFSLSVASVKSFPYYMLDMHELLTSTFSETYNSLVPIRGFNAGTGFWSFYRDFGNFFFLEMIVFWFLISFLVFLSKKTGCKGAYFFICMLCALMVFGNYFSNRSMILAIIFSNIIYFISYDKGFLKAPKNV